MRHALRNMKNLVKGAAKRLLFSLAVVTTLGGCAVYDAGYGYPYYDDSVYSAAPVYGYGPYSYGPAPLYTAPPLYVPPPVLQFNYRSWGGHHWHDGGRHSQGGGRWHSVPFSGGNGRGHGPGAGGFHGHH